MKKTAIILAIIIAVLMAVLFAAETYIASRIKKEIDTELPKLVSGPSHHSIGKVSVNLLARTIDIRNIRLRSDMYNGDGSMPDSYVNIERITASGIRLPRKDKGRGISISAITIRSPYIKLNSLPQRDPEDGHDTGGQINDAIAGLTVKKITVSNGHFEWDRRTDTDTLEYSVERFDVTATGFAWDSVGNDNKFLYCDQIDLSATGLKHIFMAGCYLLEADTVQFSTASGNGIVSGASLLPRLSKDRFALAAPGHADWTEVKTGRIVIEGADLRGFDRHNKVLVEAVSIDGGSIASYKNRKIAREEPVKPLFHQIIHRLGVDLYIGRLALGGIRADYEELAVDGTHPGKIFFTNLSGVIDGLTNIPQGDKRYYTLTASGLMMGQGAVKAVFSFPIERGDEHFKIQGSVGRMPLSALNRILEPLLDGKIDQGVLNEANFSMQGDTISARTSLAFYYTDLKIELEKNVDGIEKKRRFLSWAANTLLIKDENPDKWGTRTTHSTTVRDPYRSMFNYLWKMLMPGIKRTIGIPDPNTELSEDTGRTATDGFRKIDPQPLFGEDEDHGRQERRAERQERRQERREERENDEQGIHPQGIFERRN